MDMDNNILLSGSYSFFENGKEVFRSKNVLTKFGKRYATQLLAGQSGSTSKDIAIGIGSAAATENDTQLNFEFYRAQVNLSSIDIQTSPVTGLSTYGVVYKTTIPVDVAGIISEVGLYPSITWGATDYASKSLSTFENSQAWKNDSGEYATSATYPVSPTGASSVSLTATSSSSNKYSSDINLDILGYSANDSLTISYLQKDLNLDYVFVRLYSSNSDYYEIRYPSTNSIGHKIQSLTLNNLYSSGYGLGLPDSSSIIKIAVGIHAKSSGSSTVLLDGIRINDEDSFKPDYGLISRSVLSDPITKSLGRQMDIEYRLGLTF
jgi:hypothetical protein